MGVDSTSTSSIFIWLSGTYKNVIIKSFEFDSISADYMSFIKIDSS